MANPEASRASSTLHPLAEPSIRHSGLQYHPPDVPNSTIYGQSQQQPPDGLILAYPERTNRYSFEEGPFELPPQTRPVEEQPQNWQEESYTAPREVNEEEKGVSSSTPPAAPPVKLALIILMRLIIIIVCGVIGAGIGIGVGRAVNSN